MLNKDLIHAKEIIKRNKKGLCLICGKERRLKNRRIGQICLNKQKKAYLDKNTFICAGKKCPKWGEELPKFNKNQKYCKACFRELRMKALQKINEERVKNINTP